jgi:hypothetical protein
VNVAFAQLKNSFPIKNLLQDSLPIACISFTEEHLLPISEGDVMKTHREEFVKQGRNLYVFLTGSGRLYKTHLDSNNNYYFKRIDSTTHFGYNLGAFAFCYNNRIYNLGGYGIWRVNGQLRIYNEKANEWDIVKLNKEIPFLGDGCLLWYDIAGKKIYISYYTPKNEAEKTTLKEIEFVDDVMALDLEKNEWTRLGTLNPYIKANLHNIRTITHSPWGLLINFSDKITLIEYKQNKLLSLSESKEEYQTLQRKLFDKNIYFKDSTLFFGNNSEQTLDSVQFQYSDFVPIGQHIFTLNNRIITFSSMIIVVSISLIGLTLLIYFLRKKYTLSIQSKETIPMVGRANDLENEIIENSHIPKLFDEKEKQVLELIIEKSLKAEITNTEDLNRVLGLTKKAVEIQKKQRSDVIVSINKKYAFVKKSNDLLIEKKRADFDKRSFEYFIQFEKLESIKKHLI